MRRGDRDRLLDLGRVELDERAAGAIAGVVDHDFGGAERAVELGEQLLDLSALAGVAGEGARAGFLGERIEIAGRARRQRDLDAVLGERAGERGGEPGAGADDECGGEFRVGHGRPCFTCG
jgi:hypothetical protein